jgi:hypothetical protein
LNRSSAGWPKTSQVRQSTLAPMAQDWRRNAVCKTSLRRRGCISTISSGSTTRAPTASPTQ